MKSLKILAGTTVEMAADGAVPVASLPFQLQPGSILDRYVVLGRIGAGGMGVVYAAYDPQLDRKVAIKLLLPDVVAVFGKAGQSRFMREAQALARLSHPNVVAVYDVGTFEGQLFIAMEYFAGGTISDWSSASKPNWRQILRTFIRVGQGLAAAHRAGLVHRDIKPENILVRVDGDVRITDFGLARLRPGTSENIQSGNDDVAENLPTAQMLSVSMTDPGALVGTPQYMAPEQLEGSSPTELADQFSFCVTLYETLYGEKPFAGNNAAQIAQAAIEGGVRPAPKSTQVPGWLRKVVVRGLAGAPERRYPSMDALLEGLSRGENFKRGLFVALALLLVVSTGLFAGLGFRSFARRQAEICNGTEDKLGGVWDANRRAAIQRAFRAAGKVFSDDAWVGVEKAFGAYAAGWSQMRTESCQATRIRQEQSEHVFTLRTACLDRRLMDMKALSDLLARADAEVVTKAVQAVNALPDLKECADLPTLLAPVKPPDAASREKVAEIRGRLSPAQALFDAGKYSKALELAKQLAEEAEKTHYPPLEAETLLLMSAVHSKLSDYKSAEKASVDAELAAEAGMVDSIAAKASARLVYVAAHLGRIEQAHQWSRRAMAILSRMGGNDSILMRLRLSETYLAGEQGNYAEARRFADEALALAIKVYGPDHSEVAATLSVAGMTATMTGETQKGFEYSQRAAELSEKLLGPSHPDVAQLLLRFGDVCAVLGRFDLALSAQQRALKIWERAFAIDHPTVANAHWSIAQLLSRIGRYDESLAHSKRALRIYERDEVSNASSLATTFMISASALLGLGHSIECLDDLRRGSVLIEKLHGKEHSTLVWFADLRGHALNQLGRYDQALAAHRQAVALGERTLRRDHPQLAFSYGGMADVALARGQPAQALVWARKGLEITEKAYGAQHPNMPYFAVRVARSLLAEREYKKALDLLEPAVAQARGTGLDGHPDFADLLSAMGEALLGLSRADEATMVLEEALPIREKFPRRALELGQTQFALARSLWTKASTRKRALRLAQAAEKNFAASPGGSVDARAASNWLNARSHKWTTSI